MGTQDNLKYEYLPDVRHIMKQAGYSIGLMEILNESVPVKKEENSEMSFIPEILYYDPGDINGFSSYVKY